MKIIKMVTESKNIKEKIIIKFIFLHPELKFQ